MGLVTPASLGVMRSAWRAAHCWAHSGAHTGRYILLVVTVALRLNHRARCVTWTHMKDSLGRDLWKDSPGTGDAQLFPSQEDTCADWTDQ